MSWLFSRALVAASWAANASGGERSAQLNVMPTPRLFLHRGKTTAFSNHSQYGLMLKVLTESRGEELLTWFRGGFRARTSAPPAEAPELTANARDYGESLPGLFAIFDPDTLWWKTAQYSLLADYTLYSETWPRWGTMRDGECYQQPIPSGVEELRSWITFVSESGSSERLTTPQAHDSHIGKAERVGRFGTKHGGRNLNDEIASGLGVRRLMTPNARDWEDTGPTQGNRQSPNLGTQVHRLPTTRASDAERGGRGDLIQAVRGNSNRHFWRLPTPVSHSISGGRCGLDGGTGARKQLAKHGAEALGTGALNPYWLEWFMGWPIGWTSIEPLDPMEFERWLHETHWWGEHPPHPPTAPNIPHRVDRVTALGNGQVPHTMALAWEVLG